MNDVFAALLQQGVQRPGVVGPLCFVFRFLKRIIPSIRTISAIGTTTRDPRHHSASKQSSP